MALRGAVAEIAQQIEQDCQASWDHVKDCDQEEVTTFHAQVAGHARALRAALRASEPADCTMPAEDPQR